ncbi:MAG: hypothetical protein P1P82_11590 [Bacteroidales bacterium]|nr:hypothetical protein [Bacteroidales bacterium]MDT8431131.1 hypothetical protein [Bacteroidales bacterium]
MDWNKYFEMVIDWKKLPAYRTEPRIDSLIGYYLKEILSNKLEDSISGIIPEFPLRLGTVNPEINDKNFADRSYKVDFLAVGTGGRNYLVEFKTDGKSLRPGQDKYLIQGEKAGTEKIIQGVLRISGVSSYKVKYKHMLDKMQKYQLLDENKQYSGLNPSMKRIYVIPYNKSNSPDVIDFRDIVEWFEQRTGKDSFELALMRALQIWYDEESNQ